MLDPSMQLQLLDLQRHQLLQSVNMSSSASSVSGSTAGPSISMIQPGKSRFCQFTGSRLSMLTEKPSQRPLKPDYMMMICEAPASIKPSSLAGGTASSDESDEWQKLDNAAKVQLQTCDGQFSAWDDESDDNSGCGILLNSREVEEDCDLPDNLDELFKALPPRHADRTLEPPKADQILMFGEKRRFLIDSGACESVVRPGRFGAPIDTTKAKELYAVNDTPLQVEGRQNPIVRFEGQLKEVGLSVTDATAEDILAVCAQMDAGHDVHFTGQGCWISDDQGRLRPLLQRRVTFLRGLPDSRGG